VQTPKNGPTAVSYVLDFLANIATFSGRSKYCSSRPQNCFIHGDDGGV